MISAACPLPRQPKMPLYSPDHLEVILPNGLPGTIEGLRCLGALVGVRDISGRCIREGEWQFTVVSVVYSRPKTWEEDFGKQRTDDKDHVYRVFSFKEFLKMQEKPTPEQRRDYF